MARALVRALRVLTGVVADLVGQVGRVLSGEEDLPGCVVEPEGLRGGMRYKIVVVGQPPDKGNLLPQGFSIHLVARPGRPKIHQRRGPAVAQLHVHRSVGSNRSTKRMARHHHRHSGVFFEQGADGGYHLGLDRFPGVPEPVVHQGVRVLGEGADSGHPHVVDPVRDGLGDSASESHHHSIQRLVKSYEALKHLRGVGDQGHVRDLRDPVTMGTTIPMGNLVRRTIGSPGKMGHPLSLRQVKLPRL
mmetsp:Transcript_41715/g.88354  ORF Transcript_41715/g.88354 Transcript_41715/m.88354 type:complete len:246 (+) Transcript_41715:115-852(+)